MELVDTHAHLTLDPIWDQLGDVLARARDAGVQRMVVPAYDSASWNLIKKLLSVDGVYGAFGIHPWKADENLNENELRHLMHLPHAVAIGEIGLDFKVDSVPRETQLALFRAQVEVAVALDKPVILHCRGAFMEMLDILKYFYGKVRGVVHAFSRGPDLAAEFVRLGFHIAFGGAITRNNARNAVAAAAQVPWHMILLETDCPSIGLHGVKPENTEPMHVAEVARVLARIRQTTVEHVADITTVNAEKLFALPSRMG